MISKIKLIQTVCELHRLTHGFKSSHKHDFPQEFNTISDELLKVMENFTNRLTQCLSLSGSNLFDVIFDV